MAHDDPQRYCADRCVSTGNCDVFEDLYSLTPQEVLSFCKDCVLSDEEEVRPFLFLFYIECLFFVFVLCQSFQCSFLSTRILTVQSFCWDRFMHA